MDEPTEKRSVGLCDHDPVSLPNTTTEPLLLLIAASEIFNIIAHTFKSVLSSSD